MESRSNHFRDSENSSRSERPAEMAAGKVVAKLADAIKSPPVIANDPEANENPSSSKIKAASDMTNDPEVNSTPPVIKDETENKAQKSKNLDFRRYHICVRGFSKKISRDMLEEYYSQFGKVIRCHMYKNEQGTGPPQAIVTFSSKKAMQRALKSPRHHIKGEVVTAEIGARESELVLRVLDLSPETTEESLRDFYSKYGNPTRCVVNQFPSRGKSPIGYVTFASQEELDRALDAQPHLIDGSEVFLRYSTNELDLMVSEVPEGITEESLRTFFSRYGQVRRCEWTKGNTGYTHAFLSFSSLNEVNRAMEDRPHIIDKKILKTDFIGKRGLFPIFVGSLPENANRISLFKAFSKFGKIVHLEVRNDGGMNQRGPYGFVSYGSWKEVRAFNSGGHSIYVYLSDQSGNTAFEFGISGVLFYHL
ncbi:RNA recognition motif domain-containing protein [Ditylenchus destructor]|nr:RNA recognition motif domain-containing protein [Ditylenchus destructor]